MVTIRVLDRNDLDALFGVLTTEGFEVIGPTRRDDAIVYDRVATTADLPRGWTDDQDGGRYRLVRRDDDALFGYNLGPTSWKRFLFPPETELLRISRSDGTLVFSDTEHPKEKLAFIGVRACELAAIGVQDRVFLDGKFVDPVYAGRRNDLFVVAVNCGQAAATCFCVSMETGPECTSGYDLVLTELLEGSEPEYLIQSGSAAGERILSGLPGREASAAHHDQVRDVLSGTRRHMGRHMNTAGIRELLIENPEHPRWDDVAARCLTCGNCTLACPTCFCSTTADKVTLDGEAIRSRTWDSCFSLDFSALHGHPVRNSANSRYRQWMTHKLATWFDQFGSSGCVGCGRCITWCPVGIDITAEVTATQETVSS